jgi:hypothetical protein
VHDTELDFGFREHRLYGIREAGEAIHAGHQDVAGAAIAELGEYL